MSSRPGQDEGGEWFLQWWNKIWALKESFVAVRGVTSMSWVPRVVMRCRRKCQPGKKQQQIAPSMDIVILLSYTSCLSFHMEIAERVSINNKYFSVPIKLHQNWKGIAQLSSLQNYQEKGPAGVVGPTQA